MFNEYCNLMKSSLSTTQKTALEDEIHRSIKGHAIQALLGSIPDHVRIKIFRNSFFNIINNAAKPEQLLHLCRIMFDYQVKPLQVPSRVDIRRNHQNKNESSRTKEVYTIPQRRSSPAKEETDLPKPIIEMDLTPSEHISENSKPTSLEVVESINGPPKVGEKRDAPSCTSNESKQLDVGSSSKPRKKAKAKRIAITDASSVAVAHASSYPTAENLLPAETPLHVVALHELNNLTTHSDFLLDLSSLEPESVGIKCTAKSVLYCADCCSTVLSMPITDCRLSNCQIDHAGHRSIHNHPLAQRFHDANPRDLSEMLKTLLLDMHSGTLYPSLMYQSLSLSSPNFEKAIKGGKHIQKLRFFVEQWLSRAKK